MKRTLASALLLGVCSLGLVGCGEETKVEDKKTVSGPEGSTTTTTTQKTETTGSDKTGDTTGTTGTAPAPEAPR